MENLINWFLTTPLTLAALAFGSACAAVAFGTWVYPILKWKRQGYPAEDRLEAALLPFILDGICLAYRFSEHVLDETGERLRGVDKKKVADWTWNALPDEIVISLGPLRYRFDPHEVMGQEDWSNLVQFAMNKVVAHYDEFVAGYETEFLEWLLVNAGEDGPVFGPPPSTQLFGRTHPVAS